MFEIVENIDIENDEMESKFLLLHDGETVDGLYIYESEPFPKYQVDKKFDIESPTEYETKYLMGFSLEEFESFSSKLIFYEWLKVDNFAWKVDITIDEFGTTTLFTTMPKFEIWKNPFSFIEYKNVFITLFTEHDSSHDYYINYLTYNSTDIVLEKHHIYKNSSIEESLKEFKELILNLHEKAIEKLEKGKFDELVFAAFDFPEAIKVSCKQYLDYFATFLKDLEINVTSNINEKAGKVLFSVTPINDIELLDKIREALAVYLNLPSSPIVYDDSFASMRLQQQIENLQHSQKMAVREFQFNEKLLTAQSQTINEKNITISHQQSVIEQQNKIIEKISSKSIMIDSAENKEELEEICDGLKVGKSKFLMEQLGVHLNPATFAKGISKKILGYQDETSILDLNQEKEENN